MKISGCIIIFLWISISASAQNIAVTDSIIKFGVTAKGKPAGEKAENKIGKDGGSITSSDGKIKLIFPEGALSKKTTISIQPTTNFAPNGNGKAYQMEPSGIIFNRPVQLIFSYNETETEGNSPILLGMAMQDETGKWASLKKVLLDSVSKTLTVNIEHFSAYVNFSLAKIYPSSAKVKVNGSLRLNIIAFEPLEADDELTLLTPTQQILKWSVNAIDKGNSTVGLISASQNPTAIYQAPAQVPVQNPVAVSVEGIYSKKNLNKYVIRLLSNITIYGDAWEVKMKSVIKSGGKGVWGGIRTTTDDGSFTVSLDKKEPAVTNIINNLEKMKDDCKNILLNPTTCTGLLHVAGIKQIKITPANPPGEPYPIVEISFVPYPMEFSWVKSSCRSPDNTVGNSTSVSQEMKFGRALPWDIKFFAKDGEQIIMESPKDSEDGYLKIWVTKLKDE